jgi:hypothetical protein
MIRMLIVGYAFAIRSERALWAHKMSSRSAPSRRTSAALQSWLLDRRQQQSRALRNRSNARQRPQWENE